MVESSHARLAGHSNACFKQSLRKDLYHRGGTRTPRVPHAGDPHSGEIELSSIEECPEGLREGTDSSAGLRDPLFLPAPERSPRTAPVLPTIYARNLTLTKKKLMILPPPEEAETSSIPGSPFRLDLCVPPVFPSLSQPGVEAIPFVQFLDSK